MDLFDILTLVCGLALFLYGMDVMGDALKKSAGRKLKTILGHLTSNRFKAKSAYERERLIASSKSIS